MPWEHFSNLLYECSHSIHFHSFAFTNFSFWTVEGTHRIFPQLLFGPLAALEEQANIFVALFRAPKAPIQQGKR